MSSHHPSPRFAESQSIGRRSRALKTRHLLGRIWWVIAGVIGVVLTAALLTAAAGGIGFVGLLVTALACVLVAALLLMYPRLRVPTGSELADGTLDDIAGQAELWLEAQRKDLPSRAQQVVDHIGIQLDSLGLQLDHLAPERQSAEIGRLVGEDLPEIFGRHAANPREHALVDELNHFSGELDAMSRQLATGAADDLSLKARYLDYRHTRSLADTDSATT